MKRELYLHKNKTTGCPLKGSCSLLQTLKMRKKRLKTVMIGATAMLSGFAVAAPQAAADTLSSVNWTEIGPAPIVNGQASRMTADVSGRIDSLTVSGLNVYIGSANGGVWKTENGGQSWMPLSDSALSLAIGCVAVDPQNPNVLYAGTGELHYSADSYFGHGILKSTDGGKTWTVIGQATFDGGYISQILVDPTNENRLLVSCDEGVYKSTDGGATFTHVLDKQHTSYSMVMNPSKSHVVYASMGTIGIFKSDDFGDTWTQLTGGLPNKNFGVAAIAIDPQNTDTIYSSITTDENHSFELNGIYKSTDGGETWSQLPAVPPYFDENYAYGSAPGQIGQGEYDNCIAIDPTNPEHLVAGGITYIESMDGGQTWKDLTMPVSPDFAVDMHPDFHAIVFDSTGNIYVGTDGGVWKKPTAGNWVDLNTNLGLTQFYSGMSTVGSGNAIIGGSQDNGTVKYSGQLGWSHIFDGDGGFTAVDPRNSDILYAEALQQADVPGADIERSTNGGASWTSVSPTYQDANGLPWVTPFILSPENPDTILVGADRLYKSIDDGQHYTAISTEFTFTYDGQTAPDPIDVVAQSPSDPNVIYVGTTYGQVEATFNGGDTWNAITPQNADLDASVAAIIVNPTQPKQITLTFGGFIYPQSNHHVYFTMNASLGTPKWTDVSGNLPNSPVNAGILAGGGLFVGTDSGVYEAGEGASDWTKVGNGLPNSPVMSLLVTQDGHLVAGTHGRGAFECPLPTVASLSTNGSGEEESGSTQSSGIGRLDTRLLVKYPSAYPQYFTQVTLNTKTISQPIGFTYRNTAYMPIYYIDSVFAALGFHSVWNGISQTWEISKPNVLTTQSALNAKTGTVSIFVNGKLAAAHIIRVVHIDPYSGQETTFLPIWFIQEILRSVGIANNWDGTAAVKIWSLKYSS